MSLNTILSTVPNTTTNYILKATGTSIGNSLIWDNGTNVGIGNTNTTYTFDVTGSGRFTGIATATIFDSTSNAFRLNGNNALSLVTLNSQSVVKINAAGFWGTQLVGANDKGILINNTGEVQITSRNLSVTNNVSNEIGVWVKGIGTYSSGYASIQSFASDVTYDTRLVLQENGGSVLIGSTTINTTLTSTPGLQVSREITSLGTNAGLFTKNRASSNFFGWYGNTQFYAWNTDVGNIASINYSSGAYTAISDINKKKDIEDSTIGLNEILGINPVLFRMKTDDDNSEKQLGFIAQQVKEFIPQAYVEDGEGEDKFIGLTDRPIIAALVKAIQELNQKVENQQQTINSLINR